MQVYRAKPHLPWSVRFRDNRGRIRKLSCYRDLRSARSFASHLERHLAQTAEGLRVDSGWLRRLPVGIRKRMSIMGLTAEIPNAREALRLFLATIETSGRRFTLRRQLTQVLERLNWPALAGIEESIVRGAIDRIIADAGLSATTANRYRQSFNQFLSWCERKGYVADLEKLELERAGEPRHPRRALTEAELTLLYSVVPSLGRRLGMAGHERLALYHLAAETGLRAGEIRALGRRNLTVSPPDLYLFASDTKNGKPALLPLRPATRLLLEEIGLPLPLPHPSSMAQMIRLDCEGAKIETRGVTFHSLRHTFASRLISAGVDVKTAQMLMRHASAQTTLDIYAHSSIEAMRAALRRFP